MSHTTLTHKINTDPSISDRSSHSLSISPSLSHFLSLSLSTLSHSFSLSLRISPASFTRLPSSLCRNILITVTNLTNLIKVHHENEFISKCIFWPQIFSKKTINTYLKLEIRVVCREFLALKYIF